MGSRAGMAIGLGVCGGSRTGAGAVVVVVVVYGGGSTLAVVVAFLFDRFVCSLSKFSNGLCDFSLAMVVVVDDYLSCDVGGYKQAVSQPCQSAGFNKP